MSQIHPRIEMPVLNWSDDGVSGLVPTGTVTLLLADVEGSTRLWETASEEMSAAFANLDRTLAELVSAHHGVRPVEQGEGDSFVVAFTGSSDAVACALALQLAPLAPIRLRIGVHTGEVRLRDEGNYIGPTINRAARLRELAHGGQTVLSGITERSGGGPAARWGVAERSRHPSAAGSSRVLSGWCSYAIPTCTTSSRRCGNVKRLLPNAFRSSSPVSSGALTR